MKHIRMWLCILTVFACAAVPLAAQTAVPPPAPEVLQRSPADLDQLLGPIALYPDPLIAQILPAATVPSEIVLADRYLQGGGDPDQADQQPWDPSVQALARYPNLVQWMDENLAWTTEVGEAFEYQQQDVMDAIQRLRAQAQALGNLQSTPEENVYTDDGDIEILPANPQVIYVPVYQPGVVFFERPQGRPWVSFGVGLTLGAWLNHDMDWRDHHLIVWHHDQPRPSDWWFHRPGGRPPRGADHATVWQPHKAPGLIAVGQDRGWNAQPVRALPGAGPRPGPVKRTPPPAQRQPMQREPVQRPPVQRPPVQRPSPVQRPLPTPPGRAASGAFIGIQSSQQARQFSDRGRQSRQTMSHPTAPARSQPQNSGGAGRH